MNETGQLTNGLELGSLLSSFPAPLVHAFGYGSGVFAQENDNLSKRNDRMIDIILTIECAKSWHEDNLQRNKHHYSTLARILGPSFVAYVQDIGPGLYFHPFVEINARPVKYGVISKRKLMQDLLNWDYLYVAGRLHKPTQPIVENDDETIEACDHNLTSALAAALLIQKSQKELESDRIIGLKDIFSSIASLSYSGDFRMQVGAEDSKKVEKLVNAPGQYTRWCNLYKPSFEKLDKKGILQINGSTEIETISVANSPAARREFLQLLPARFRILEKYIETPFMPDILSNELANIVAPATRIQGAKGLLSAGIMKSITYAGAKFAKGALKGVKL